MTKLEQEYDTHFTRRGRKNEYILLDILMRQFGYEQQYLKDRFDNIVVLMPDGYTQRFESLAKEKCYEDILGSSLALGAHGMFDECNLLELQVGSLYIFDFLPSELMRKLTADKMALAGHIQQRNIYLGSQYPDKVYGYTLVLVNMSDPNGKQVHLTNYNLDQARQLEQLFQAYNNWFTDHSERLERQFMPIIDEVRDWLKDEYKMNPAKDGFIEWFIANKLQGKVKVQTRENSNNTFDLLFNFDMLKNEYTPEILDQHLHEYCRWRKNKYKQGSIVSNGTVSVKPPSQTALAMYYYYAQEAGSLPPFPMGEMEEAYKKAVEPYGLSWKSFQNHYGPISNTKVRLASGNLKSILQAINMLRDGKHVKALNVAETELKVIQGRTKQANEAEND